MQSVTCGNVYSPVCWLSSDGDHVSSSSSELFQQRSSSGLGSRKTRRGKALSVTRPCGGRAALGLGPSSVVVGPTARERSTLRVLSSLVTDPSGRSMLSAEQKVFDVVAKQASMLEEQQKRGTSLVDVELGSSTMGSPELLSDAYARCGEVCAEYAKTFYLGMRSPPFLLVSRSLRPVTFLHAPVVLSNRHGHVHRSSLDILSHERIFVVSLWGGLQSVRAIGVSAYR